MIVVAVLCFVFGVCTIVISWRTEDQEAQSSGLDDKAAWVKSVNVKRCLQRLGCAGLLGLATLIVTRLPSVAMLAFIVGLGVPTLMSRRRDRLFASNVEAAWPEVVDGIVSSVRAGMSLPEGLCSLAVSGPEAMRERFRDFDSWYRPTGDFEGSLLRLRDQLADPVADRVIEALIAAREVGGTDLGTTLGALSEYIRKDLRFRGEARARQSWTINGARLAIAAPWVVLILLATRPGTVEAYSSPTGTLIIFVTALVTVVAYNAMIRLGQLSNPRRFAA